MQACNAAQLNSSFPARHSAARCGQPAKGRHCARAASGTWMLASRRSRCRRVWGSRGKTWISAQLARTTCVSGAPPRPCAAEAGAGAAGRWDRRLSSTAVICMEPCTFCFGAATVDPTMPEMLVMELRLTSVPERGRSATAARPRLPAAKTRSSGRGASNARLPSRGISRRSSTSSRGQTSRSLRTATSPRALHPLRCSLCRWIPEPLDRTSAKRTVAPGVSPAKPERSRVVRKECLAKRLKMRSGSNDTPLTRELNRNVVCFSSNMAANCLQLSAILLCANSDGSRSQRMVSTCCGKKHTESLASGVLASAFPSFSEHARFAMGGWPPAPKGVATARGRPRPRPKPRPKPRPCGRLVATTLPVEG
mmetsp:Transcript_75649/g.221775  ORF Transcript_75649/g.221775 Transcript_75649/m.221775 type:complete len:366 (+) Transcript_75649:654-1751(+)